MELFLEYFEQFRFIAAGLFFIFLPVPKSLKRRDHYAIRMTASVLILLGIAMAYVPIFHANRAFIGAHPLVMLVYWIGLYLAYFPVFMLCYDIRAGEAMFRIAIGSFGECLFTILFHDVISVILFPNLAANYPWAYILIALLLQVWVLVIFYFVVERDLRKDVINRLDTRKRGFFLCLSFLLLNVFYDLITRYFLESGFKKLFVDPEYERTFLLYRIFAITSMILISLGSSFVLQMIYRAYLHYDEKHTMERLANERMYQLDQLKENVAVINKKSHDLKNQIYAFTEMDPRQREKKWSEVKKALEFYDANVSTGSEAIDALIMEKGLLCKEKQIRFTPVIKTDLIPSLPIYELSTILGNGLDNAIEASIALPPESRSIRLEVSSHANIVYLEIANYFQGQLDLSKGLPKTHKKDKAFHGFGLKSIAEAARTAKGAIEFKTDEDTFLLSCVFVV